MKCQVRRAAQLLASLLVLQAVGSSLGLVCYKCTLVPPPRHSNETERMCSQFDPSHPKYQVQCPFSTFCMKKSIQLNLPGGKTVRSALRDCAAQKNNYQSYSASAGWQMKASVEATAYTSGCHTGPAQTNVATPADQYCYCDTNLCNAAPKPSHEASSSHTDAMAVIFVFNAMKYVRSLR